MSVKRVLHLITSAGGGGAERQLSYLATGQRELGLDVHIGILLGGVNLQRMEASGATLHWISSGGNYDPFLVLRAARLIRRLRPSVVQTWLHRMDVIGGAAALLTRTPWIAAERSSGSHYPTDTRLRVRRIVGKHASAVIANSPGGLDFWRFFTGPTFVIPNAVPLAEIEAADVSEELPTSRLILFVGRLDEEKNLHTVVNALAPVIAATTDVVALFCGSGPLDEQLQKMIDVRGCNGRIRLCGFRGDIWRLMKRAAVFVSASWYEGHPNAVIEAAAAGCPLVLSDIPAHRAFLDESMALFAAPTEAGDFSSMIRTVLTDRDGALGRAASAKRRVAEWSIPRVSREYVRIYEQVLS
jgi:glycosyltransferase involved in cell wall biosynthesis